MRTPLRLSKRWVALPIVVVLIAPVLILTLGAPVIWPDRPIPSAFAPYVDSARASLRDNVEGLRFVHLRLDSVRCRADGGTAYTYDQIEAPYLQTRYAIAMTGILPPTGWSGGVTLTEINDPELLYFLGEQEVPCASR